MVFGTLACCTTSGWLDSELTFRIVTPIQSDQVRKKPNRLVTGSAYFFEIEFRLLVVDVVVEFVFVDFFVAVGIHASEFRTK